VGFSLTSALALPCVLVSSHQSQLKASFTADASRQYAVNNSTKSLRDHQRTWHDHSGDGACQRGRDYCSPGLSHALPVGEEGRKVSSALLAFVQRPSAPRERGHSLKHMIDSAVECNTQQAIPANTTRDHRSVSSEIRIIIGPKITAEIWLVTQAFRSGSDSSGVALSPGQRD
jgi:hypothetical protein